MFSAEGSGQIMQGHPAEKFNLAQMQQGAAAANQIRVRSDP